MVQSIETLAKSYVKLSVDRKNGHRQRAGRQKRQQPEEFVRETETLKWDSKSEQQNSLLVVVIVQYFWVDHVDATVEKRKRA